MSQYDQAFQEPEIKPGPTYSHWDTIPVIITVDNYGIDLDIVDADGVNEATKSKVTFNLEGDGIRGLSYGALRDVVSIELISASVPVNNAEIYIILKLNNYAKVKTNNTFARNAFCILSNDNPSLNDYYSLKRFGNKPDDNFTYYFPEPTKLTKLDIEFLSPTGEAVVFAETDPVTGAIIDPIVHTNYFLTFEIRMLNSAPKPEARFRNGVAGGKGSPWQ